MENGCRDIGAVRDSVDIPCEAARIIERRLTSLIRMAGIGRSYPLTKGLTGLNRISASSSKADVQNVRARGRPDVCFWPKADID